jgi:ribosome-associated heat shock protein Hsp15
VKGSASPPPPSRRLDQWLWFARFVKSRSLAARLCTAEAVTVNGLVIRKANHTVRIGDTVVVPQGAFCRTVRVLELGLRRGPAAEARLLYEEIAVRSHRSELRLAWEPLLVDDEHLNEIHGTGSDPPLGPNKRHSSWIKSDG